MVNGISFFDCNAHFGVSNTPSPRHPLTPGDLLAEMDWCGVDEALVTNAVQRDDAPVMGNERILSDCAQTDRLHPVWVLMPHQTGEFPEPTALADALRQSGVRALWAAPSRARYLLDENTFGATFDVLAETRVPLLLSVREASGGRSGWALAAELLMQHPTLTLVSTDQDCWGQDRNFRPLVEKYPRFYFDVADYELAGGYEDYCNRYGPERMLFATGHPGLCMGGSILTLLHANISEDAKRAIAGDNMRRLLAEVQL